MGTETLKLQPWSTILTRFFVYFSAAFRLDKALSYMKLGVILFKNTHEGLAKVGTKQDKTIVENIYVFNCLIAMYLK